MGKIEVIYIVEDGTVFQRHLPFQQGQTVEQLVNASGLYQLYPDCQQMTHGIFGRSVSRDTVLQDGDRIEIYRPLPLDPMKKRRLRAKDKK